MVKGGGHPHLWGGVADYRGCGLVKGVAKRGGFDGAWRAQSSVEGLGKH